MRTLYTEEGVAYIESARPLRPSVMQGLRYIEVGLVTGEYLIWSLVQALSEVEPIGCMARGVDGFSPKTMR